jgi:glutamate/aspartate transport system permease protein
MLNLDVSFLSWDLFSKFILKGLVFSLELTAVAALGGLVFGTLLALMRLSNSRVLKALSGAYVNGMRSIPLVMVILWFYLLIPVLIGKSIGAEWSAFISPSSRLRRRSFVKSCEPALSPSHGGSAWLHRLWG